MKRTRSNLFLPLLLAAASLTGTAFAAPNNWLGTTNASWSTPENWSMIDPPIASDTVTYVGTDNLAQTLDGSYSIAGIAFGPANATAQAYVINNGAGTNTLTLGTDGINTTGFDSSDSLTIGADIVLGGNQSWKVRNASSAADLTVSGVVSGSGNLTFDWVATFDYLGTVVLTGANTYTGVTTIKGSGTVGATDGNTCVKVTTIGNGGVAGNLGAASNAATSLVLGANGQSAGQLNYVGTGGSTDRLFTLSGHGAIANNGSGALNFTNVGSIAHGSGSHAFTLGGTNTANNTFAPVIANGSGTVNFAKADAGTWVLTGANTYTGTTTLTAGTLSVATIGDGGTAGNLGAAPVAAANLVLGGGTLAYTGVTASTNRNFTLTAGTTSTINVGGSTVLTMSGSTTATTGALTKTGTGILALTGTNLHTGSVFIGSTAGGAGGTIRVNSSAAIGGGTADIWSQTTIGGSTFASTAAGTLATGRSVFLFAGDGGITFGDAVGTGDMSFVNIRRGLGGTNRTINVANSGQTVTFTGNLANTDSSNSGTTFNKGGAGTLTISGTGATAAVEIGYSKITVTGGTLNGTVFADLGVVSSFGRASAASATGLITLNGGAIGLVDGGSSSSTNRPLQIGNNGAGGAGTILNNATSNTLTFTNATLTYGTTNQTRSLTLGGSNTGANTFATAIGDNGASGAVSLTKTGNGTWILSSTTNTYTGNTTVNGGTLSLATASLADASTVSIASGAILDLTHGADDTIHKLFINGVEQAPGLYKSSTGVGLGTVLASLTGSGKLQVTTGASNTFATWMSGFDFSAFPGANLTANGDADGDGISNLVEHVFGTVANGVTAGLTQVGGTASSLTFKHRLNPSLASDVTYSYQWSSNLGEWKSSGQSNTGGTTATISAGAPVAGFVTVTTTVSAGPATKLFVRVIANKAP